MPNNVPSKKQWAQAFCVAPQNVVHKIHKILSADGDGSKQASGAFKRKCGQINAGTQKCFKALSVKGEKEEDIRFYAGDLPMMLEYICGNTGWYRNRLFAIPNHTVSLVLTADECTGGNVLSVATSKKVLMVYCAILELGELHRPGAYLPLAAIPARDVAGIKGPGTSAIFVALLQFFQREGWFNGFTVLGAAFQLKLFTYLGDYESVRAVFGSRGASAIRPCCLCMNVLAKGRVEAERDNYFTTIEEASTSNCQPYDTEELFQLYDRYLREFPNMSKRQAEEEEKFFGWNVDPASLMAKPDLRALLSLKHLMLDSCHCYFSNGCVSQEIVLFMNYLGNEHNVQLEDIQKAAKEVKWNCSNPDYRSPSAIGHLFHPSLWNGTCHKGEATASWYLLPLLGFYGFELLDGQDPLEWQSFKALLEADLFCFRDRHHFVQVFNSLNRETHE